MNVKKLIKKIPFSIKQSAKYLYGAVPPRFRYSKVFWDTYNFLQESQWWSREKLENYQMQQLSRLLRHAYENVPYYHKVFDERGLKPKDIQKFENLKKLPYLTKDIIRENLPNLIVQNYPKSRLEYVTTGGSTGIPLGFYRERGVSNSKESAFMITQWNRVGFKIGDKRVILRGNVIKSANKNKFWEYNPIDKTLILSSYHMTAKILPKYIEKIREFQPDFFHVYPSAITILARFMKDNKIGPFSSVKALLCGSENLYFWQRALFEEIFQCRVFSWYGHAEQAVLAGECERSKHYHIFPEYGIVELIDENTNIVTKKGESGEIVATGFNNYTMPFIRYRTMDIGTWGNKGCQCKRKYQKLEKIDGRLQELLVTKNNGLISMTAINMHSNIFDNIKQFQFYQDMPGKVIFKVIRRDGYTDEDTVKITLELMKKLGEDMELEIIFVDEILKTARGKYRFLEQKLEVKYGD